MRVLVTGMNGQVARSLMERDGAPDVQVTLLGRPQLDLSHPDRVVDEIIRSKCDVIVSSAAYTAVDKAEEECGQAFMVNYAGASAVARASALKGVPIIHLSTDYVYPGNKAGAYVETDMVGPKSVYGHSKLAGELGVAHENPNHVIARTAWVYSQHSNNFVKTMLRIAETKSAISVVDDQIGCPTSASDLANAILDIARNLLSRPNDADLRGTFHASASGQTSWAGFAKAIFSISHTFGGPCSVVDPITSEQYVTAACRPKNSVLDNTKLARVHGVRMPSWDHSLISVVRSLVKIGQSG